MTLQSREILDSRSITPQIGGKVRGRREFKVWDDTGASVIPDEAVVTVGIELYDPWPGDPSLLAVRPGEMRRVAGHNSLVELPWFYENITPVPPGTRRPDEVGYVEQNTSQRREFVKLYRTQPDLDFPESGNLGGNLKFLTDGLPNDIRGFRLTAQVYRVTGVVTEIVDRSPAWTIYGAIVGTRNSEVFFGGAVGKVVYVGARSRSVGINRWAVTHEFLYDEWFHLVQIADRDQDGNIILETFVLEPGQDPITVAKRVFWRQPFPELADFHLLSDYFQSPGLSIRGPAVQ